MEEEEAEEADPEVVAYHHQEEGELHLATPQQEGPGLDPVLR